METVSNVRDFAIKNESQVKKFMVYKTGIHDREVINDQMQDFYVRLIEARSLDKFDSTQGTFKTYIGTLLCWELPIWARKNMRVKYRAYSKVLKRGFTTENEKAYDIWDFVNNIVGNCRVARNYDAFQVSCEDEMETDRHLSEFKDYIRKTESQKNAQRMILYLDQKYAGCKSVDIALSLGVSANMVKIIKQNLQDKYHQWNDGTVEAE